MKKIFIVIIFLLFSIPAFSQSSSSDTDKISILAYLECKDISLIVGRTVNDSSVDADGVTYYPPFKMYGGFEAEYKGFSLAFSIPFSQSQQEKQKYGVSKSTNISAGYFADSFGVDLTYQKNKNYYLSEPEKFGYTEGSEETKRNDISSKNIGMNSYFCILNYNEYSLRNGIALSGVNRNFFTCAFILMGSVNYFDFSAGSSILPESVRQNYGNLGTLKGGSSYSATCAPGFGASLSFFGFYVSPSFFIGGGPNYYTYKTDERKVHDTSCQLSKIHLQLGVGCDFDAVIFGINLIFDMNSFSTKNEIINNVITEQKRSETEVTMMSAKMVLFAGVKF